MVGQAPPYEFAYLGICLLGKDQFAIMKEILQTGIGLGGYYEYEMGVFVGYPDGVIGFCRRGEF